jgi:hypothetical protein
MLCQRLVVGTQDTEADRVLRVLAKAGLNSPLNARFMHTKTRSPTVHANQSDAELAAARNIARLLFGLRGIGGVARSMMQSVDGDLAPLGFTALRS